MRLREFAPSPERDHNDDVPDPIFVLANRWWNAGDRQPQIEHVLNSLGWSIHQVESEDDAVQLQHRDGTTYFISADDFDPDLFEYSQLKTQRAHRDGIDLSFEKVKDDEYVDDNDDKNTVAQVTATSHGKELGHVVFSIDGNTLLPQDLEVDERYRGQGIAKIMYDYVKSLGYQIRRSGQQTDAGAGFWSKHRPSQNVWETELNEFDPDLHEAINTVQAHRGGLDLEARSDEKGISVYARDAGGREIAAAHFDRTGQTIISFDTSVRPEARGQGIAAVMYDWAKELGYRVKRSPDQTDQGRYFWQKNRGQKRIWETELNEIARIPQSELGGWGDKDTIEPMTKPPKNRKPLPGGSGYTYAVNRGDPEFMEIMIFDGDTLAAELDLFATLDPLKTWRVETVVTDPDYRGRGMGKALYGIALSILKLTIEAGETQTKFGQAMWLMLDSIPGVEVLGYTMEYTDQYRARPGDRIVDQNDTWTRYTFPVEPGKRSMRSGRPGTGIYSSQYVSMIAKWAGQ